MSQAGVADAVARPLVTIGTEVARVGSQPAPTSVDWRPQGLPVPANEPLGAACARGLCYRPMTTVGVTLGVRGASRQRDVFLVPDAARTMVVQLPQGVFAQQKYVLVFSDGVLTEYGQNTKSELVGFSTLPVSVVTAILKAPATALGLRTADLKAQADYLAQLQALQTAQASAAATCRTDSNVCPLTALKIIGARITPPVSDVAPPAAAPAAPAVAPPAGSATQPPWLHDDAAAPN